MIRLSIISATVFFTISGHAQDSITVQAIPIHHQYRIPQSCEMVKESAKRVSRPSNGLEGKLAYHHVYYCPFKSKQGKLLELLSEWDEKDQGFARCVITIWSNGTGKDYCFGKRFLSGTTKIENQKLKKQILLCLPGYIE